jgi:hypothetical protein
MFTLSSSGRRLVVAALDHSGTRIQQVVSHANCVLREREFIGQTFIADSSSRKQPSIHRDWHAAGCGPSFLNYAGTEDLMGQDNPRLEIFSGI